LWLTDENIPDQLVQNMRSEGITVETVKDRGMLGKSDQLLLDLAYREKRIILTQDSDFGTLVFAGGQSFWGIVYVRPGHF
jgi:predicted nuclease of predicted toxin-antitoxin system